MAIYDDMLKGLSGSSGGILTGVGALIVAPLVVPVVGRLTRPLAKTVLQAGITLYREVGHAASGLVEEARAEMSEARHGVGQGSAERPRALARSRRQKHIPAPVA